MSNHLRARGVYQPQASELYDAWSMPLQKFSKIWQHKVDKIGIK